MSPMNPFPRYHSVPESPRRTGTGYIPGASSRSGENISSCPHCRIAIRASDKHCPNCGWLLGNNGSPGQAEPSGRIKDEFPSIPPQPRSEPSYRPASSYTPAEESTYSCPICKASNNFKSGRCLKCGYIGIMVSGGPAQPANESKTFAPSGKTASGSIYHQQTVKPEELVQTASTVFPAFKPSVERQPEAPPVQQHSENISPAEKTAASSPHRPPRFDDENKTSAVHTPTTWPGDITALYRQKPADVKRDIPVMPAGQHNKDEMSAMQKTETPPPSSSRLKGGIKVSLGPVVPASSVPAPPPPRPFMKTEPIESTAAGQKHGPFSDPVRSGEPYINRSIEKERIPASAPISDKRSFAFEGGPAVSPWKGSSGTDRSPAVPVLPVLRALGLVAVFGLIIFGIVRYAVPWVKSADMFSAASAPATALLTIENVSTFSVTDSSAVITWETSEQSTGQVAYGVSTDYENTTPLNDELSTSHQVTLTGLEPETTYYYMVESVSTAGQTETITNQSFTTIAMIDSTPPHISDVIYTDISDISAVIEWTTDEAATGQVAYGTSTDYGQITELNEELTTTHSVTIRGLEPETSYYFKILSCDTNQNEASHQAAQSITTAQAIPVGIEAGCRAPDFTLTTYDGDSITLSDYRGKIVLLNFWALSCGPCKAEMPFLQAAHENQAASGLAVIAVNPSDSTVLIEKFVQENGLTFSIPRDQTRQTAKAYSITAIPRTFFIDTKGIIRKVQTGRFKSEADIEKILNSYDW